MRSPRFSPSHFVSLSFFIIDCYGGRDLYEYSTVSGTKTDEHKKYASISITARILIQSYDSDYGLGVDHARNVN